MRQQEGQINYLAKASYMKSSLQSMMKKEKDQCHVATAFKYYSMRWVDSNDETAHEPTT